MMRKINSYLSGLRNQIDLDTLAISKFSERELVESILDDAYAGRQKIYTYATAHTLLCAATNTEFRNAIEKASVCYSDGMGVVLHERFVNRRRIQKVTANNFFHSLMDSGLQLGLRIALIGSQGETAERVGKQIMDRSCENDTHFESSYRSQITSRHGYFSDLQEEEVVLQHLEKFRPSLVVVGMGQPLQEAWAVKAQARLPRTTFLCVGGLFDYLIGKTKTPDWFRRSGFEWLFRLYNEPARLWRRYLLGLPALATISAFRVLYLGPFSDSTFTNNSSNGLSSKKGEE